MESFKILDSYNELINKIKKTPVIITISNNKRLKNSEILCDLMALGEISEISHKYNLFSEFFLTSKHFNQINNVYVYTYKHKTLLNT